MRRRRCRAKSDWRERTERLGLSYVGPGWDESAYYELSAAEVEALETSANTLHQLCLQAAALVVERGSFERLGIPAAAVPRVRRSWKRREFSLYGRFDLAFDGNGPPKLLEYNVETPTTLLEAGVAQWLWLQERHPGADQFNAIHERLVAAWRPWARRTVYFSSVKEDPEDEQTVLYLMDTCQQAGVKTRWIYIEDIGWDRRRKVFVDLEARRIEHCFKLYPWEWLWREQFGVHLVTNCVQFIEPAWKMLLANKAILPLLWELFPGHPNLLPAYESPEPLGQTYVRKPKLGRLGSNITWADGGVTLEQTTGAYGDEGYIWQAPATLRDWDGQNPVFGVWVIGDTAAGLGIREDAARVTSDLSRFVPHVCG